jgi:hypothetical protein
LAGIVPRKWGLFWAIFVLVAESLNKGVK